MKNILFIFIFILIHLFSFGYYDFNSSCKKAFIEIMNLRFDNGRQLIETEKKIRPANDIPYFIENYIDFLTIMIGEEEDVYLKLLNEKSKRIQRLERGEKNSPYYKYCLAELELQWAFCRIKFNDYLTAAYEINKAYRLLSKNQEEYSWFILNLKGLGVIHSLSESVPPGYKWIINVAGMESATGQGANELNKICLVTINNPSYHYLKLECAYLYSSIQWIQSDNKNELKTLLKQLEQISTDTSFSRSPLLTFCKIKTAYITHDGDLAEKFTLMRQTGKDYFPFYYLDYLTGLIRLDRLDNNACNNFTYFISNYKGKNFIRSAYQKLAWCYLIQNDFSNYKKNILNVKKYGHSNADDDQQAEVEATGQTIPNIALLKARLLCDGGYFQEALKSIKHPNTIKSLRDKKDSLEYFYRTGRILHESGKLQQCIPNYQKTLEIGANEKYYFAANAALQLGLIYEKNGNTSLASNYYTKVFTLKNTEYKNSIEQKAKAGLKRLKKK